MDDIIELESRLSAALERIGRGIEAAQVDGAGAAEVQAAAAKAAALEAQLGEEKAVNARLEEQMRLLSQQQESEIAAFEGELRGYRDRFAGIDRDLQRLRQVNEELREINAKLREAMDAGVAEPHLINKSMLAEIEALRAAQAADRAEVDALLSELKPLIEEAG